MNSAIGLALRMVDRWEQTALACIDDLRVADELVKGDEEQLAGAILAQKQLYVDLTCEKQPVLDENAQMQFVRREPLVQVASQALDATLRYRAKARDAFLEAAKWNPRRMAALAASQPAPQTRADCNWFRLCVRVLR